MRKVAKNCGVDSRWEFVGYAVLCTDESTGQPYWHTYNGEGDDECRLSLRQPVLFPTKKFPLNSVVRVYVPKGESNENN